MGIRMRYYAVSNETNIVINCLLWDGVSEYSPAGVTLIKCDDIPHVKLADRKNNNKWERYDNELEAWIEVVQ